MNVHDSEKVVGTLLAAGLPAGDTPSKRPGWSSTTPAPSAIRPSRRSSTAWPTTRSCRKGQELRRAGLRGAAGRRKDFRARAPRVAGVRLGVVSQSAGDAGAARGREPARHRPRRPRDRRELRNRVHRPQQSAPRLHHHHRRLRQILRLLRGAVHARHGAQPDLGFRAGRGAADGRSRLHRNPAARPEREQLPRSRRARRLSPNCWRRSARFPASGACASPLASARFRRATSSMPSTRFRPSAITCICRCRAAPTRVLDAMERLYTRDQYMDRIDWMKAAKRRNQHHHRHHRRLSRRDRGGFRARPWTCWTKSSTTHFQLQVFAASQHAVAATGRRNPGGGKVAPPDHPAGEAARDPDGAAISGMSADP